MTTGDANERRPEAPWSQEAEISVLGAMLIDDAAVPEAVEILGDGEAFYKQAHTILYGALRRLHGRDHGTDVVAVAEELRASGDLKAVGGMKTLADLVDAVPSAANIRYHAKIVADMASLRRLREIGEEAVARSHQTGPGAAGEVVARTREELRRLSEDTSRLDEAAHDTDAAELLAHPEELKEPDPILPGILWPGEFTLVCGPPKIGGKTSLLVAGGAAIAEGGRFLGSWAERGTVLWIMAEGSKNHIGRYLAQVLADPDPGTFIIVRSGMDPVGQLERAVEVHEPDSVVIDSLGTWIAPLDIDMNSEEVVSPLRRLERIARSGPAVGLIHHGRKEDGDPAGSHKIKAVPDVVRVLEQGQSDRERVIHGTGRWRLSTLRYRMDTTGTHPTVPDLETVRFRLVDPDRQVEEKVLDWIDSNPGCSKRAIRDGVKAGASAIDDAVESLIEFGVVEVDSSGGSHSYRVRQNPYGHATDTAGARFRHGGAEMEGEAVSEDVPPSQREGGRPDTPPDSAGKGEQETEDGQNVDGAVASNPDDEVEEVVL